MNIIDQCVAQGVPFAREYGGLLDNRSFGGAQVSRTFYARGPDRASSSCSAPTRRCERQIGLGTVTMHARHEMLELVVIDGRARGIVVRDMVTGAVESHVADAVVLATGGYGNVFFLADQRQGLQRHRHLARLQARAPASATRATRRSIPPASRAAASTSRS